MMKRRNQSDGERAYLMTGRVPLTDLASWQEEEKINNGVKTYSGSRPIELNLVPQTYLKYGADMSDGLRLNNLLLGSRPAHNIHPHPYFLTLKFCRCVSHLPLILIKKTCSFIGKKSYICKSFSLKFIIM
jgi:hypothetical protein